MNFEIKIVLNKNGENCYLCIIRKRLIKATPEEKVRQEILKFLIEKKGVPINMICVEMRLDKYGIEGTNERADIVIETQEDNEGTVNLKPIVVIECKSNDVALTYKTIEQVENYSNKLGTLIYGVVNGIEADWYIWCDKEEDYFQIKELPDYQFILQNEGYTFLEQNQYLPTIQREYQPSFPKKLIPFVENLSNLFEDTKSQIELPRKIGNISIIENSVKVYEWLKIRDKMVIWVINLNK